MAIPAGSTMRCILHSTENTDEEKCIVSSLSRVGVFGRVRWAAHHTRLIIKKRESMAIPAGSP